MEVTAIGRFWVTAEDIVPSSEVLRRLGGSREYLRRDVLE